MHWPMKCDPFNLSFVFLVLPTVSNSYPIDEEVNMKPSFFILLKLINFGLIVMEDILLNKSCVDPCLKQTSTEHMETFLACKNNRSLVKYHPFLKQTSTEHTETFLACNNNRRLVKYQSQTC